MSVIDDIMLNDSAIWINEKINDLPDRAKFRASSAIRALSWANKISDIGLPIPACYCALHATEEAVAAFVSCAKECGYGNDAKINIKDHLAKATISLLAQKIVNTMQQYSPAIACNPDTDLLAMRFTVDGQTRYFDASTKVIVSLDHNKYEAPDFYDAVLRSFGSIDELKDAVLKGQKARNEIFYASSEGMPSGFKDPESSLMRECQITLGLIWTAIDMNTNRGELLPFISQALRTANMVIAEVKAQK